MFPPSRLNFGVTTLYLHTTSILSGLLPVGTGLLLATGQMTMLSRWALRSPLTCWVLRMEDLLRILFIGS